MNETERIPERERRLVDDYLDGHLDEAGTRELEERLSADADLRRYFARYSQLHTDLHLEARAQEATERIIAKIDRSLEESARPVGAARPSGQGMPHLGSAWPKAIAVAACLVIAFGAVWWFAAWRGGANDEAREGPAIAWLVNAQNCLWADGAGPGEDLRVGKLVRLERG